MEKFFIIYLANKEIAVKAKSKGDATSEAIRLNLIEKWDLFEDLEIFEVSEKDYLALKNGTAKEKE